MSNIDQSCGEMPSSTAVLTPESSDLMATDEMTEIQRLKTNNKKENYHQQNTIVETRGKDQDQSKEIEKNKEKTKQFSSRDLILLFANDFQMKVVLYDKSLQSYEQIDFNLDSLFIKQVSNEDDDVFISKIISKAKHSLDQMSILKTKEYHHLKDKFNYIMECNQEVIGKIRDKIQEIKIVDEND